MKPLVQERWKITDNKKLLWDVERDTRLPHADHIEMSGRKVSVIVHYSVDAEKRLEVNREVIFPMLRIRKDDVRGYLRRVFGSDMEPTISIDGFMWKPERVREITFNGIWNCVYYHFPKRIVVDREIRADSQSEAVRELWTVYNFSKEDKVISLHYPEVDERVEGIYGTYQIKITPAGSVSHNVKPRRFTMFYWEVVASVMGTDDDCKIMPFPLFQKAKWNFDYLQLQTPDTVLNTAFHFAKMRTSESIFETKRGLMHSPGGGRYYGGVWANDQAEYAGPFFPFIRKKRSMEAALNTYRLYSTAMNPEYKMLPSSFEVEGDVIYHAGGDRGDAAMVAYGAARFALASGKPKIGKKLYPLIQWCLEYCRRKTNDEGVVESDTDELEGRFPTGTANLSTSSLAYGALISGSHLAFALGEVKDARRYLERAFRLRLAIEQYFGAEVEGYQTYRYYDGNEILRSWICLPLCMGIKERAKDTIDALLSPRLWTDDGLATQSGDTVFWDRATLYAIRGMLIAGDTERAMNALSAYSRRRLLGEHVPYPVEAWPEGDQAHLAAESALYCRIFTEGLFGIEPVGFHSFRLQPRLPKAWNIMALSNVRAFDSRFDVVVTTISKGLLCRILIDDRVVYRKILNDDEECIVTLPE